MRENRNENDFGSCNFAVRARKNETPESLIKRFLKKQKKEKVIEEVLERKKFKKNTTKRREAIYKRNSVLRKLREKEQAELLLLDN
jgi:hypothetical protein